MALLILCPTFLLRELTLHSLIFAQSFAAFRRRQLKDMQMCQTRDSRCSPAVLSTNWWSCKGAAVLLFPLLTWVNISLCQRRGYKQKQNCSCFFEQIFKKKSFVIDLDVTNQYVAKESPFNLSIVTLEWFSHLKVNKPLVNGPCKRVLLL